MRESVTPGQNTAVSRGRRASGFFVHGLCLSAVVLLLAACASAGGGANGAGQAQAGASEPPAATDVEPFVLQSSDALDVKFFYHPELNETVIVRPDGKISLQLIGEVQASGLTPKELEQTLIANYRSILLKPEVTVIVRALASRQFSIFGEVNAPGSYPLENGMIILNGVAKAGGFTYRARTDQMRIISARDPSRTPRPAERSTRIMPGDVIEILERYF